MRERNNNARGDPVTDPVLVRPPVTGLREVHPEERERSFHELVRDGGGASGLNRWGDAHKYSAGIVWYAATQHSRIGRLDPVTGRSREFPLPKEIRFVHTVLVHAGQVWFTGNPASADWGTLDPNTGDARPYESRYLLVTASDDAVWIGLAVVGTTYREPA